MKKRMTLTILSAFILLLLISSVNSDEIKLKNIGSVGIQNASQEYTSLQTIIIELNLSENATNCNYKNDDEPNWAGWELCVNSKIWLLSPDDGLKTVNVSINHSDGIINDYYDTIFFNFTGAGLDTTPPSNVNINFETHSKILGDSGNSSLTFSWSESYDYESAILNLPITYGYIIYLNATIPLTPLTLVGTTRSVSIEFNLSHNDRIYYEVIAFNSGFLNSTTKQGQTIIDFLAPSNVSIACEYNDTDIFYNSKSAYFNWTATDETALGGFSYVLTQNEFVYPDYTREGTTPYEFHLSKNFTNLPSGAYYFKIVARDKAGNWGETTNYTIHLDSTPPERVRMIRGAEQTANQITFSWYKSYDKHTNVSYYEIEIFDNANFTGSPIGQSNETYPETQETLSYTYLPPGTDTYYARVRAIDLVGNVGDWSSQSADYDISPPIITSLYPGGSVFLRNIKIILSTNEYAICFYLDTNNNITQFEYTGSIYHETNAKNYNGRIYCYDSVQNEAILDVAYSVTNTEPTLSASGTINAFTSQIIPILLTVSGSTNGVSAADLTLDLNEETVTQYSLVDQSAGTYLLYIKTPNKAGQYILNISNDANSQTLTLNVNQSRVVVRFDATQTQPPGDSLSDQKSYTKISYANDSTTGLFLGLGAEGKSGVSSVTGNVITAFTNSDDKAYIFLTSRVEGVNKKESDLNQKLFLDQANVAFGSYQKDNFVIYQQLSYNNILLNGSESLSIGRHNLLIKRVHALNKKTLVISTTLTPQTTTKVTQYG